MSTVGVFEVFGIKEGGVIPKPVIRVSQDANPHVNKYTRKLFEVKARSKGKE
jgi:hypothetical protein